MQITDMLNQYNRNIANGTEISGGTQGIKQIVSSLQEMSVGNVFEGSINHMENGVATLGLPDGKSIQAKLDAGVSVHVGETMFFQVRSNNGTQIAIRPFSSAMGGNPALLNALKAANLQVNGRTITMVNTMMEQSMPIDKQSLMQMARLVMGNDGMDAASIVQMAKLGIPITEEMAAQFSNYKSDQYAILDRLDSIMEMLPEKLAGKSLSSEELLEFNRQMAKIFLGGEAGAEDGRIIHKTLEQAGGADIAAAGQKETVLADGLARTAGADILPDGEAAGKTEGGQEAGKIPAAEHNRQDASAEEITAEGQRTQTAAKAEEFRSELLKNILSGGGMQKLAKALGGIPEFLENPAVFREGALSEQLTAKETLRFLEQAFASKDAAVRQSLSDFVSSKDYRSLIRNVMEQQWLLRPEELQTENKVRELYERLDRQMEQMEKVLKSFGQSTPQMSETAANVRDNIQFMNQLNQTYAYVQIPLKLAGQNAHSDLYVYTDKRRKQEKDGELTAFLHLDMDHLGSTDVSVKMQKKQVHTIFYLTDDASYQLISENMGILEKRLMEKGYSVKIQVSNQEEKANFVEDILKQGTPSAGGMVHRYSFDVRA